MKQELMAFRVRVELQRDEYPTKPWRAIVERTGVHAYGDTNSAAVERAIEMIGIRRATCAGLGVDWPTDNPHYWTEIVA